MSVLRTYKDGVLVSEEVIEDVIDDAPTEAPAAEDKTTET